MRKNKAAAGKLFFKLIIILLSASAIWLIHSVASKKYPKNTSESNNAAKLDDAINRAKDFYINEYLLRSLKGAERGKTSVLFYADGKTGEAAADYAPAQGEKIEVFNKPIEYQLYIVVHFLMYFKDWGYEINDPIVERAKKWLVSTFDPEEGRWAWSKQGCLHSKAIIALVRLGEKAKAEKAMEWALKSDLRSGYEFSEPQTDSVIHSVSSNVLTNFQTKNAADGTANFFSSREGTAKFLYAMAALGMADTTDFKSMAKKLEQSYTESITLNDFIEDFGKIVAVSWVIYAYEDYRLPEDGLYIKAKEFVIALAKKDLSEKILTNYSRGKILMALSLMRDEKIYALRDEILKIVLDRQFPDGHWEPNGSKTNKQPSDWDESQMYDNGFLLNYKGGRGSTTKTMLESLIVFRNNALNSSTGAFTPIEVEPP